MILELALSAAVLMGVHGNATLNCVPTRPKDQASMICTCMNPTKNGIEWRIDSVVSTSCLGSSDTCIPPVAGYTSDVSKDEFYAEVSSYTYSNCATYSCKDPTTGDEVPITTSIRDFNSSMPTAITEPGSNKNGTVQITTNCLFKETDIIVKWYTISQTDGTKDYDPETNFSTPTNCTDATKTCNEERAVTLNIGFEHTEKSVGCVKFKLEVYHSADPSDKIELVTTGDYCIKDGCKCPLWECNCEKCSAECIICWILYVLLILLAIAVLLVLIGVIIEFCSGALGGCYSCGAPECCQSCDNDFFLCKCCGSCCNIEGLPFWYHILWWTVIGTPVALGIFITVKCRKKGNGDVEPRVDKPRHETQSGNQRTDQKKPDTKKNKSTDSVVHIENEQHNQGRKHREQPLLPPHGAGAATGTTLNDREDSGSAVSREHVELQESGRTLPQRPMPDIPRANDRPGHDSKGRGLSANFSDDYHPLASIDTPSQKAGALGSLPEGSSGGEVPVKKLKKRKKKSKGDQED